LNKTVWDFFLYFRNEETLKRYLENRYERLGVKEIHKAVYEATPKIIFNIIHAEHYFRAGECADVLIKPVLLYYGMINLSKALINSIDATYPTTTSVLKHGLSTRKLKKNDYKFVEDEVKVQSGGLFVSFHQCLTGESLPPQMRLRMGELLSRLPECTPAFDLCCDSPPHCTRIVENGENEWLISRKLLQSSGLTRDEFLCFLNGSIAHFEQNSAFTYMSSTDPEGYLHIRCKEDCWERSKLVRTDRSRVHWLCLPVHGINIPELSTYFVIMFTLSMLCRYETERWGELILTYATADLYIINDFMASASRNFPNLILHCLFNDDRALSNLTI